MSTGITPTTDAAAVKAAWKEFIVPAAAPYYKDPLVLVEGNGSTVVDAEGHEYLDFFCGILTNMLGYDVPEVRAAVQRQLDTGVVHTSTLYLIRNQVELAEKLARLSGIENAKVLLENGVGVGRGIGLSSGQAEATGAAVGRVLPCAG